jgi:hypothetical protein
MKSNVGGVTVNRRVRGKEAATPCEALVALKGSIDPTVMLIGDTNILNNTEPAIETFIDSDYVDLNNNDTATFWSAQFDPAPFDCAFVAKERPEFKYSTQYVLKSADLTAHDRFLSDHYMIKVSVKDYFDDADPRPTAHSVHEMYAKPKATQFRRRRSAADGSLPGSRVAAARRQKGRPSGSSWISEISPAVQIRLRLHRLPDVAPSSSSSR